MEKNTNMPRPVLVATTTALMDAMTAAAKKALAAGKALPKVVAEYVPSRAVKRGPAWRLKRR